MSKELHLICNAHIDPIWQWEWEEGACETLSTFRVAAKFCREFDGFIFCHNEALLYQWVEEYEPSLFEEIKELVKLGKWHIMGGWHLQPDCNMPSGEGFVRNILAGRKYFSEKFGVKPTTAINFDPFGHTRGLVQILAKSGYDSYIFCRPYSAFCRLPSKRFKWIGYDGSEVIGVRASDGYNTGMGHAIEKMDQSISRMNEQNVPLNLCLWGVGNHGGGPSRVDLLAIAGKLEEWEKEGIHVLHSTPESYFAKLIASQEELPVHEGDLNLWAPGCYTSQVRVKQKYRRLENELFACEKMCSALAMTSDFPYPEKEFGDVLYDLLMIQFHDALPGSSIQAVEEMALRMADHGLEILSRVRAKAFFRLSHHERHAQDGEIPIIAYNPHPYAIKGDFECEFVLADQNRTGTYFMPAVYQNGAKIPSQPEKERSNVPIDWRKKVVFHATLPPMQISRFDCRLEEFAKKPYVIANENEDYIVFDNCFMHVEISKKTGLIDSCIVNGKQYLERNAFSIDVYQDDEDPWGMRVRGWTKKIDEFRLLAKADASAFSALNVEIPSVRCVENGDVRTTIEAVFGYSASKAVVRYHMSKHAPTIELELRIINADKQKMYKLAIPFAMYDTKAFAEVAFGEEPFKTLGVENIHQKYVRVEGDDNKVVNLYNDGVYASSIENNKLLVSLMRSPAYCAHPVEDLTILPQDRHSAYIEQGERRFHLKLTFGKEAVSNGIVAQTYNEKPIVLSFFPSATDAVMTEKTPMLSLEGGAIVLSALKKAEKGKGFVLRLFNPQNHSAECRLKCPSLKIDSSLAFSAFECKTFRIDHGVFLECDMMEE